MVCAMCVALTPLSARVPKPKPKAPELHATTIQSVNPNAITIVEDNKVTKSFAITQFTEISVNGQRAAVTDLQPGMSVSVTMGADPSKLSRIDAGAAPVMPAAPKR